MTGCHSEMEYKRLVSSVFEKSDVVNSLLALNTIHHVL